MKELIQTYFSELSDPRAARLTPSNFPLSEKNNVQNNKNNSAHEMIWGSHPPKFGVTPET